MSQNLANKLFLNYKKKKKGNLFLVLLVLCTEGKDGAKAKATPVVDMTGDRSKV